jgi:hypothetical protein
MSGFVEVVIRRYSTGGGNLADQISHGRWRFSTISARVVFRLQVQLAGSDVERRRR